MMIFRFRSGNAKKVLNSISICCSYSSDEDKNALVFQGGDPVRTSQTLAESLDTIRCKWDITCGVFCRDQKGKHWAMYCNFRFLMKLAQLLNSTAIPLLLIITQIKRGMT
ncbi:hypothetical protein A6B44_05165 [Pasteurella skyensis]|nr:hypothetical protein A6B44_05165 [Pasteurella skyensis]